MTTCHTATVFPIAIGNTVAGIPSGKLPWHFMPMRYPLQIAEHRKRRNLTQGGLAEIIGVEQPTVQRWESGKRTPDAIQIGDLAEALGIEPGELFKIPDFVPVGPRLFVKGEVQAGAWREAYELPREEWETFTGRSDVTAKLDHRFGLRVIGDSMNIPYPHGTIVECVSVFGTAEIVPGKRVVIIRRREDLEYEATVKELVEQNGEMWAVPRSTNPTFQAFRIDQNEPGVIETRVAAIVVSSVRPE